MFETREPLKNILTVRPGDAQWYVSDGLTMAGRAGMELDKNCPKQVVRMLEQALVQGWIRPVAHIYDYEAVWDTMNKEDIL
jgi:hypothetical protein